MCEPMERFFVAADPCASLGFVVVDWVVGVAHVGFAVDYFSI